MDIFGGHHEQGGGQAPVDCIYGTAEVPTAGVAFCAACHPDIGMAFQTVEDKLHDAFLPDLFKGATSHIPGRVVTSMPFK